MGIDGPKMFVSSFFCPAAPLVIYEMAATDANERAGIMGIPWHRLHTRKLSYIDPYTDLFVLGLFSSPSRTLSGGDEEPFTPHILA